MPPPQATEGPRAERETPPVTSVTTITHLVVSSLPAGPSLTVLPQPPGEGGTVGGTESGGGGRPEALTQGVGVAAQTAALAPTWAPHPRLLAIPWCVPRGPPRITAWKPWGGLRDTAHRPSCRRMGAPSTGRGPQPPAPSPQPRQGLELQWGHLCPRPSAQNISCQWRAGRAGSPCLFVRTSPSRPSHLPRGPAPCTGPHPAQKPYPPSSQGWRRAAGGGLGVGRGRTPQQRGPGWGRGSLLCDLGRPPPLSGPRFPVQGMRLGPCALQFCSLGSNPRGTSARPLRALPALSLSLRICEMGGASFRGLRGEGTHRRQLRGPIGPRGPPRPPPPAALGSALRGFPAALALEPPPPGQLCGGPAQCSPEPHPTVRLLCCRASHPPAGCG